MFCFETALKLYQKYSFSTFFYFFTYSLWNESLFNKTLGPKTRYYFVLIALCIFIKIDFYYNSKTFHEKVYEKKGDDHEFISFVSKNKIPRIINTLLVFLKEIAESTDDSLGLNRLGSHCIENFIGRIRCLCHMDNRFETILHNISRYEMIVRDFDECFLVFKPKHSNPGGTVLNQEGNEIDQLFDAWTVASWLFEGAGLEEPSEKNELDVFLTSLSEFSRNNPYQKVNLPSTARNAQINVRLFSTNNQFEPKKWSDSEIELIDQLLLSNNGKKIFSKTMFQCSKADKHKIVDERKSILKQREWTSEEDDLIRKYINKEITLQQLRNLIILRDKKQITQRKNDLLQKK